MISDLLAAAVSLIAPPVCVGCGCEPPGSSDVLCRACRSALPILGDCCPRCALPSPCSPCPAIDAPWQVAKSACLHEGAARSLVAELKRSGATAIAAEMATVTAGVLDPGILSCAALVPVPPHPARRRSTGVDHSLRYATALSTMTGRPVTSVLRRGGRAHRQAGASRGERLAKGRLDFHAGLVVPPACILVDDVHTTGATLGACSNALLEAGAERLACVTFTRAADPMSDGPTPSGW